MMNKKKLFLLTLLISMGYPTIFAFSNLESNNEKLSKVSHQYFCDSKPVKLKDLVVFNTQGFHNILWYTTNVQEGKSLNPNTLVKDSQSYFAFQGMGPCFKSVEVKVHILNDIPKPNLETHQVFCKYQQATLRDVKVLKKIGFENLFWFKDKDQITAPLNPETKLLDGDVFYAFHGLGSCVKGTKVIISINENNEVAPIGSDSFYCEGICQLSDISIKSKGSVYWFDTESNIGEALKTNIVLKKGKTYFAYRSLSTCAQALAVKVVGEESLVDWSVSIHPNPVVCGVLYIDFQNITSKIYISLTDTNGKIVYSDERDASISNLEINMKKYESGVYFLKIKSANTTHVEKLIID